MTSTIPPVPSSPGVSSGGGHQQARSHPLMPVDAYSHRSMMAMDVYRRASYYCVEIDLPGVEPSSIEVELDGEALIVSARRARRQFGPDDVEVAEREHGRFSRELFITRDLRLDELQVRYDLGVLTISVPTRSDAGGAAPC